MSLHSREERQNYEYRYNHARVPTKSWHRYMQKLSTNMLAGLADEEVDRYIDEHLKLMSLFTPYVVHREEFFDKSEQEAIRGLQQAQESLEREMEVPQQVKASHLEEVNLGTGEAPKPVKVAKEMQPGEKLAMVELL